MTHSVMILSWVLFLFVMLLINYLPHNFINSSNGVTKDRVIVGGLAAYYAIYGVLTLLLFRQGQAYAKSFGFN